MGLHIMLLLDKQIAILGPYGCRVSGRHGVVNISIDLTFFVNTHLYGAIL